MNRTASVSSVRTRAQILLWRHGWALPLSIVALIAAGGLQVLLLQPVRAELVAVQAELARQQSSATAKRPTTEPWTESRELAALQAALHASAEPAELVRKMAALAQAQQIALQQGDYQQQLHASTRLVQVHVTQPVRATYPQLRRYIESVLRTVPNASLDQVAARRENVGQAQLEARLRWSFWIQKHPVGPTDDAARNIK